MKSDTSDRPTKGQLQRTLSQQLQKLYREELNLITGKTTCQLLDNKLTIVIEDSLTQPEQILLRKSSVDLVEKIRVELSSEIKPKIVGLIEEILHQEVVDILSDTTLETGRTGMVVVLS